MSAQIPDPAPASPCCNVCQMDPVSGWCRGCWRSLDEIARWGSATVADQRAVLKAVVLRRQQAPATGSLLS